MEITSGISEKVEVIEEDNWGSGTGDSKEFGHIESLTFSGDAHSTAYYSTDGTNLPNDIIDGILEFSGDLSWKLTDGREFYAILGDMTDGGTGSYTIDVDNSSPGYSFKAVLDDSQNVHIKGAKFSKFELNLSKDEIVKVTGSFYAQNAIKLDTAVTPQVPSEEPYQFTDAVVTFDDGSAIILENLTLTLDKQSVPYRGIEDSTDNEKRLITAIVNKNLSITGNASAIADSSIFESVLGGNTLIDYRSNANLVITLTRGSNNITVTIPAKLSNFNKSTSAEDDLMLIDFDFIGKDVDISGTYATT